MLMRTQSVCLSSSAALTRGTSNPSRRSARFSTSTRKNPGTGCPSTSTVPQAPWSLPSSTTTKNGISPTPASSPSTPPGTVCPPSPLHPLLPPLTPLPRIRPRLRGPRLDPLALLHPPPPRPYLRTPLPRRHRTNLHPQFLPSRRARHRPVLQLPNPRPRRLHHRHAQRPPKRAHPFKNPRPLKILHLHLRHPPCARALHSLFHLPRLTRSRSIQPWLTGRCIQVVG